MTSNKSHEDAKFDSFHQPKSTGINNVVFQEDHQVFAVTFATFGVVLIIASCDDAESEMRSIDDGSQNLTTPTSTPPDQASRTEPTITNTPTVEKQTDPVFTVNSPVVNVRQGPGTNFTVVDQVTQGEEFEANGVNQAGDWLRFCCVRGGGDGWIYKPLVIIENERGLSVARGYSYSIPHAQISTIAYTQTSTVTSSGKRPSRWHANCARKSLFTIQFRRLFLFTICRTSNYRQHGRRYL